MHTNTRRGDHHFTVNKLSPRDSVCLKPHEKQHRWGSESGTSNQTSSSSWWYIVFWLACFVKHSRDAYSYKEKHILSHEDLQQEKPLCLSLYCCVELFSCPGSLIPSVTRIKLLPDSVAQCSGTAIVLALRGHWSLNALITKLPLQTHELTIAWPLPLPQVSFTHTWSSHCLTTLTSQAMAVYPWNKQLLTVSIREYQCDNPLSI